MKHETLVHPPFETLAPAMPVVARLTTHFTQPVLLSNSQALVHISQVCKGYSNNSASVLPDIKTQINLCNSFIFKLLFNIKININAFVKMHFTKLQAADIQRNAIKNYGFLSLSPPGG